MYIPIKIKGQFDILSNCPFLIVISDTMEPLI